MAKKSETAELQTKAERKLEKAQSRLRTAEDDYSKARARGERKIAKARLKAEVIRAEAAELVQRRAAAVGRAETRLRALHDDTGREERVDEDAVNGHPAVNGEIDGMPLSESTSESDDPHLVDDLGETHRIATPT